MACVLTLTANTLVDFLAVSSWKVGSVNRFEHFVPTAGGKALNVSRVLARHGHHVVAAGFAGGATGELLREAIAADGLEPALVTTRARTRIGFQVVHPEDHQTTVLLENGFPVAEDEVEALVNEVERRLPKVNLVILGGSVPDDRCRFLYARILAQCATAKVPCWVDAYGPAMHEALSSPHPPSFAKPNQQEFGDGSLWSACQELHITDGPHVVRVKHPHGRFCVTPPPIHEVNPIGSGDCYVAGLAHARLVGMNLEAQLRYAAAAGAANAARPDVAEILPAEIVALTAQTRIDVDTGDDTLTATFVRPT